MNSESEEEDNVINGGDSRMIYTMTLSPALDYIISIENFNKDTVNRNEKEEVFVGGKGINVSQVLKNLDIENVALGFVAGFTGEKIERDLAEYGCFVDFVHLRQGMSRINIKIKGGSGVLNEKRETEINGMGPTVPQDKLVQLFERLDQISTNDILVLAGSAMAILPEDIYVQIIEHLKDKKIRVVLDAEKQLLLQVLPYHPFLIKPNRKELAEACDVKVEDIKTQEDVIKYAKQLQEIGARNVLVSLAEDGAVLLLEDGTVYSKKAPKGELVDGVGAGNSMIAGFIAGFMENEDYQKAFDMALAAGSACAFREGLPTSVDIAKMYDVVKDM